MDSEWVRLIEMCIRDRETCRGQTLPRLHDGFGKQVSADLLRHRESVSGVVRTYLKLVT